MDQHVLEFLRSLTDPEGFGHAVTQEVRDIAKMLIRREEEKKQ
jgi:hypothetical protein